MKAPTAALPSSRRDYSESELENHSLWMLNSYPEKTVVWLNRRPMWIGDYIELRRAQNKLDTMW